MHGHGDVRVCFWIWFSDLPITVPLCCVLDTAADITSLRAQNEELEDEITRIRKEGAITPVSTVDGMAWLLSSLCGLDLRDLSPPQTHKTNKQAHEKLIAELKAQRAEQKAAITALEEDKAKLEKAFKEKVLEVKEKVR